MLLADIGAIVLRVAPVLSEIALGSMVTYPIRDTVISGSIALCSSKTIPRTVSPVPSPAWYYR